MIKHPEKLIFIALLTSLFVLIASCSIKEIQGEYIYVEPIYRGGVSSYYLEPPPSLSYDSLLEQNKNNKFLIEKDRLIINYRGNRIVKNNLIFEKKKFKYEYFYGDGKFRDKRIEDFLADYKRRYIISISEESGAHSGYCLLLLDDDVFIAELEKRIPLITKIDRIKKK